MNLVRTEGQFALDVKRFRMPYRVEGQCPKCGANYVRDFSGDAYLSYPVTNTDTELCGYCSTCDHQWPVIVLVDVVVRLIEVKDRPKDETTM
jgi:hypothetical protein